MAKSNPVSTLRADQLLTSGPTLSTCCMPYFLLYRTGLAATNGTSVQLSRLISGAESDFVHVLWDVEEAGSASVPYALVLDNTCAYHWPFRWGRRLAESVMAGVGIGWWDGLRVNQVKLRRALMALPIAPKAAYVICMREWDARRIVPLLNAIGKPPFLLHVMDIFHDQLTESETPCFIELVRAAEHVICISENIEAEMLRCGANITSILPCVTDFSSERRDDRESPLRLVITGMLRMTEDTFDPALDLLARAWPELKSRFPSLELHYAGGDGAHIPDGLRDTLVDHGRLTPSRCEALLSRCHIAYLPVSHGGETMFRYSIPSRIADYLACGLPTITATDSGSAIFRFMSLVPEAAWRNATSAESLIESISYFGETPTALREASLLASRFAKEHLSSRAGGKRLFSLLSALGTVNCRFHRELTPPDCSLAE